MKYNKAVVIGSGLAGLMAARVLADHYDTVHVLEKDRPDGTIPRKGVPQGNHIHVIWSVGSAILEDLFPGLFENVAAAGGTSFDNSADMRWFHGGVWKLRQESGLRIHSQSRPLLEYHVRQKLLQYKNVDVIHAEAIGIDIENNSARAVAVRRGTGETEKIETELIVDASGRGSRMPGWLEQCSFPRPKKLELKVGLRYASRLYERNGSLDWRCMAIYARPPHSKRSGVIFPIEDDRWIVTFGGCFDQQPGSGEAAFLQFARSLEKPDIYNAIVDMKPASEIHGYQFAKETWHRYDQLSAFPDGIAMIGDAFCSFNPLYGQGVTVAALEAQALQKCLRERLPLLNYQKASAKLIRYPWMLATSNDYLYPEVASDRPFWTKVVGRYTDRLLKLSETNPTVSNAMLRVLHLAKTPLHLVRPGILMAALRMTKRNARLE